MKFNVVSSVSPLSPHDVTIRLSSSISLAGRPSNQLIGEQFVSVVQLYDPE